MLCSLILTVFSGAVTAQTLWTTNGVPICASTDDQKFPVIASDDSGGAFIAWQDARYASDDIDIYAQRIDSYGQVKWATDGLFICWPSYNQISPEIIADGNGGAIIVWEDYRSGSSYDIYAQKMDGSGNKAWIHNGEVISDTTDDQEDPQLVGDGAGGAIIVWEDERYGSSDTDIFAQRINASGNTMWQANGVSITGASSVQIDPQITPDGFGGAVITWKSWIDSTSSWGIYAQRINSLGSVQWTVNGVSVCSDTTGQSDAQITGDGMGGAIITWVDLRNGEYDLYAQRIDSSGTAYWPTNGVVICTTTGEQWPPQITSDGLGGAIITWRDDRWGTSDSEIYAQRIDADGNVLWPPNGLPICSADHNQGYPRLLADGPGDAIITWMDARVGYKIDIYAQRVDAFGNTLPPADGQAVSTSIKNKDFPHLISDGMGGAIITWQDQRNGKYDIYAQRVNFKAAPHITSITDVPGDQGGQVAIRWNRSYLDHQQYQTITDYTIWRKYPHASKIEFLGREWDGTPPRDRSDRIYQRIDRIDRAGRTKTDYWEYIDLVEATYLEGYAYIAPTLDDSSAGGIPYYSYFISANTSDPFTHWHSAPDSGYSVDDISPSKTTMAVAHGTGKSAKGSLDLSWDQVTQGTDGSPETGPVLYHLYCDTTAFFTPGPGNLITDTPNLSYQHADARIGDPATDLFYQVVVTDGSGNTSQGSNRTGEIDWSLSSTTGTDYAWLALALDDTSLAMASDLEAAIEAHSSPATNCLTISQWNPTAQTYTHYTTVPVPMGNFPLTPGQACRVEVSAGAVFTLTGGVPAAGSVSFDLATTTGTDYTWVSLPLLNLSKLTMASDLEAHIEAHSNPTTNCLTVSEWNPTAQTYTHYTTMPVPMGDFAIRPGRAYRVEVTADAVWPYSGKGPRPLWRIRRSH